MAQLGAAFNPQDHDTTQSDFSPLPNGIFRLEVSASDVVPTKAGTGTILKLTYDVVEPEEFKGRRIFGNLNIENPNSTAQQIGQKELASLCRAVELSEIEDSESLHFITFTAKVGLEKPQPGYAQRNKILRFYFPDEGDLPEPAIDDNQPKAAPTPANDNRPAAAPAKAAGSRPWPKR